MNDCENEVFSRLASALRTEHPDVDIAGEYVPSPAAFPHVSIVMADNSIVPERQDSSESETDVVLFEINVYSNKATGRKSECKAIAKTIDKTMFGMNFMRLSMTPVPNMENPNIYRIVSRYRGTTDGKFFYRR